MYVLQVIKIALTIVLTITRNYNKKWFDMVFEQNQTKLFYL